MTPTYVTDAGLYGPSAEIGLNVENASPPINAYVGKDDSLQIMVSCSQGPPLVIVVARTLMPDGTVKPNIWRFTPNLQRTGQYTQIPLPECFILSLSVQILLTGSGRSVFIAAMLFRGGDLSSNAAQVLCEGYVSPNTPLSWPVGFNTDNQNCVGNIRSITGTTPAAGANISETVPVGAKWRPIGLQFTLTCAVAVASRFMVITLDDGTNVFASLVNSTALTASQVGTFFVLANNSSQAVANFFFNCGGFQGFLLNNGYRIRTAVIGLQAGDQLSAPQYLVEEWLIP